MAVIKNQFKLMGRVGKYNKEQVVDFKYFDSGKCCAKIRLGVRAGQNKDGSQKWDNIFITFWNTDKNNIAEQVAEYLREGDYIQVIGKIRLQEFTPESMQGQVDANGNQKKVQRVDLVGTSYKRVRYNEEMEDFEIVEAQ